MNGQYQRTELLIGKDNLEKLKKSKVVVVGLGGVGSFCAESLARSGVGNLVLIDKDSVDVTNLNRQIQTNYKNIGLSKVEEMKKRIASFSDCNVLAYNVFYDEDTSYLLDDADYVVDCIDTISSKFTLIKYCFLNKIKIISSMGMANRLRPELLCISKIEKTFNDPVSKILRGLLKKHGIKNLDVIFSKELAVKQKMVFDGESRKEKFVLSSIIFVPASAGLLLGSFVVNKLIEV